MPQALPLCLDVIFHPDVGNGQGAVNPHNEVNFYFSRAASWGFAPPREGVTRNTCDTADQESPGRMCWHTQGDAFRGGWRCGASVRLNESDQFERLVFTRTEVALGRVRAFGHHGECDSFNGCVDAVGTQLAAGADAELVSDDGETALALAAASCHPTSTREGPSAPTAGCD